MIAVHGLDNSIENLLRLVIDHLDIGVVTGKRLETSDLAFLAGEVNRFLQDHHDSALPYLREIKSMRQIRNLVQHGMVDAGPDIGQLRVKAMRFFDRVLNDIFGIKWDEVRVSSLVSESDVKRHLETAEHERDEEQFLEAVVACRNAFENALYAKTKSSALNLFSLSVLMESKAEDKGSYWFYTHMLDELQLLRLGVDATRYSGFLNYIRHIPSSYSVNKSAGHTIMQRPWNNEDASFCYGFVADTVLKWQNEQLPPLYDKGASPKYERKLWLDEVELPERFSGGGVSILGEGENIEQFYTDGATKEGFETLVQGRDYDMLIQRYKDDVIDFERKRRITLKAKSSRLVTNDPERWACTIWYAGVGDSAA